MMTEREFPNWEALYQDLLPQALTLVAKIIYVTEDLYDIEARYNRRHSRDLIFLRYF
jgi:hypothetical protein